VLATAPLRGPGLDLLRSIADVVEEPWIDESSMRLLDERKLSARIGELGATVIICEADRCAGAVLDEPLIAIGSTRGDPTNVDIPAATAKGIPVLHAPGRNADGVAEMTLALLLAVNRHVLRGDADVRAGNVFVDGTIPYQRFRAWQLAGGTAGIVGLGAVGRATRWRLEGLGMTVLSYDPFAPDATHTDLDAMLGECDVVSMHAAVTPDTFGLMNTERFAAMRDGAIYLNSARAALHDMDALVAALGSGHLGGAGLDHFEGEALPAGHPILGLSNVVLTPHIGGATYDTEANHTALIAADLEALLNGGTPMHCANPEVLARTRET
jgi:D-3-phosphoglycerate dehydrogenase